jgi:hypothetical protein
MILYDALVLNRRGQAAASMPMTPSTASRRDDGDERDTPEVGTYAEDAAH